MNIRKTRKEDVPVIMDLYENAKAFMRSKGNLTQWNDGYPSVEIISELIRMKITSRCRMQCSDMDSRNVELYTSETEVREWHLII